MSLYLIGVAILLAVLSGVPALLSSKSSTITQRSACIMMCLSAAAGLAGCAMVFIQGGESTIRIPWPALETVEVSCDALSAFFLVPVFIMGFLGSLYGLGYWPQHRHLSTGRKVTFFWGTLIAGMMLLVIGRHALAFLIGWEMMALSAFFLVSAEDRRRESRTAGLVYIVATHFGTLGLFALFVLWKQVTGSYLLVPVAEGSISFGTMNLLFFLALFVFGLKAGVMPLHFWLPSAHATAPTHVSAILSGVVLKMGIYGLVRWVSLFPAPPYAWGTILLVLGLVSGITGVVFAISQHNFKRLLAYHSVENIGIILMGLGIALIGKTVGKPELVLLGMAGALLHVWNHSFFKSLLFFGAGAVVHQAHTRMLEKFGGAGKLMPQTAALFLLGAVAICGLPPLNGFVSELFVYLGFFTMMIGENGFTLAAFGIPVLAMTGALAAACFVKVFGTVFLGMPRSALLKHGHEPSLLLRLPMMLLAALCLVIGLAPWLTADMLEQVVRTWYPGVPNALQLVQCAPLNAISIVALSFTAVIVVVALLSRNSRNTSGETITWDCGYARPSNSMQYSASSFAHSIVTIFKWLVKPHVHKPEVTGIFPLPAKLSSHVDEPVLDRMIVPAFRSTVKWSSWFFRFQHGMIQHYILYVVITLFVLLCTQVQLDKMVVQWFTK